MAASDESSCPLVDQTLLLPLPQQLAGLAACRAVLDVRSRDAFVHAHAPGSTHIPEAELPVRLMELPPRRSAESEALGLVATNAASASSVVSFLATRHYTVTAVCILPSSADDGADAAVDAALTHGSLDAGDESRRLWTGNPCLCRAMPMISAAFPDPSSIDVLDLACGTGRDAVLMALQGWSVTGIDYLDKMLQPARVLAERWSVPITLVNADLERGGMASLQPARVVVVARYLHRPSLPLLADLVKPGGFLVYHTFMRGCEVSQVGRPKQLRFLLEPGELRSVYHPLGWAILVDEVVHLDDGRPTSCFIAQRPACVADVDGVPVHASAT